MASRDCSYFVTLITLALVLMWWSLNLTAGVSCLCSAPSGSRVHIGVHGGWKKCALDAAQVLGLDLYVLSIVSTRLICVKRGM